MGKEKQRRCGERQQRRFGCGAVEDMWGRRNVGDVVERQQRRFGCGAVEDMWGRRNIGDVVERQQRRFGDLAAGQ